MMFPCPPCTGWDAPWVWPLCILDRDFRTSSLCLGWPEGYRALCRPACGMGRGWCLAPLRSPLRMPHVPALAERVTGAFSLQWCSWTQPRWDSPGNCSFPGVGWRWPLARQVPERTGSLRASEVTTVRPGDEDSGPREAGAGAGSPLLGQDRGTARPGLAQDTGRAITWHFRQGRR